MADTKQTGAERAETDARTAEQKASEAQAKADEASKSPEQKRADEAKAKADDARAKAEQAKADEEAEAGKEPTLAIDAGVNAVLPEDMTAGHHRAQKIGVDPANPKPASAEHEDPDKQTVRLQRFAPDVGDAGGLVYATCHPEMVGDYLRAGWSRAA